MDEEEFNKYVHVASVFMTKSRTLLGGAELGYDAIHDLYGCAGLHTEAHSHTHTCTLT